MSEQTEDTTPAEAPAPAKPTPLELLRRNPNAITDVVYGPDHPERGKKARSRRNTPPQDERAAVRGRHGTLLGDVLDTDTRTKLSVLQWKLERAQTRKNTGRKS